MKLHIRDASASLPCVFSEWLPPNSVLVLSDFHNTNAGRALLPVMNAASSATKAHVKRTAVLGVTGVKHTLADMLVQLTGQPLKYFDDESQAKVWLISD